MTVFVEQCSKKPNKTSKKESERKNERTYKRANNDNKQKKVTFVSFRSFSFFFHLLFLPSSFFFSFQVDRQKYTSDNKSQEERRAALRWPRVVQVYEPLAPIDGRWSRS